MDLKLTEHVRNNISLLYMQKKKKNEKKEKKKEKKKKKKKTGRRRRKTGEILIFGTFFTKKNQFWPIFR